MLPSFPGGAGGRLFLQQNLFHLHPADVVGLAVGLHGEQTVLQCFGGDDDHAVGGTAAVDAGGRGVFQYLDALDVARVERVEVLRGGYPFVGYRVSLLLRQHSAHEISELLAGMRGTELLTPSAVEIHVNG